MRWFLLLLVLLPACQSGAPTGTACERDSECAASLVCRLGRCRAACTENRDCPIGTQCFLVGAGMGACQLEVDRTCGASCPSGLSCLADQCLRACTGASECPSDGTCAIGSGATVGVCTDARGDDAGPIDAATVDDVGIADAGSDADEPSCRTVLHACAGGSTTCAILDDHTVACWGNDINHQTGAGFSGEMAGSVPYRSQPVLALDIDAHPIHVDQIACSDLHVCGVTSDGHVLCWGAANTNLRGDGSGVPAPYATPVMFDQVALVPWGEMPAPRAGRVAVGREHACAMSVDRDVVRCWGRNQFGELGDGTVLDAGRPATSPTVLLQPLASPYASIVLGDDITCATDDAGHVACVGRSEVGELGVDLPMHTNAVAAAVDPHVPARALTAGNGVLCGLDPSGIAICAGINERQQLGRMTTPDRASDAHALAVAGTTHFDSLWSGSMASTTFALVGTEVYAWGDNFQGAAALSPIDGVRLSPQHVATLHDIIEVTADAGSGCAVSSTGVLSCWGTDMFAQLGRGAVGDADPVPAAVCLSL